MRWLEWAGGGVEKSNEAVVLGEVKTDHFL